MEAPTSEHPRVDLTVMHDLRVCPCEDCDGECAASHQRRCEKPLRDPEYDWVSAVRCEWLKCGRAHRTYPKGVSRADYSDRLKGAGVLVHLLGISYLVVEVFLTGLGAKVRRRESKGRLRRLSGSARIAKYLVGRRVGAPGDQSHE